MENYKEKRQKKKMVEVGIKGKIKLDRRGE